MSYFDFVHPEKSQTDTFRLDDPCCILVFARSHLITRETPYDIYYEDPKTATFQSISNMFKSFGPGGFPRSSIRVIPTFTCFFLVDAVTIVPLEDSTRSMPARSASRISLARFTRWSGRRGRRGCGWTRIGGGRIPGVRSVA